jgi:tetratricopeptide (TPR) repeat protein
MPVAVQVRNQSPRVALVPDGAAGYCCRVTDLFLIRFAAIAAWIGLACPAALAQAADPAEPPAAPANTSVLSRQTLYLLDPPPAFSTTPMDPTEARLKLLDETEEEEFSAPPLVVARISSLPPVLGDSPTQALLRAERNLLRERVRVSDRYFREGQTDEALAMLTELERMIRNESLRTMIFNRLAAYYFRMQRFDETVRYAREAWNLNRSDYVSACNLAATLLTIGEIDEALDILLRIYGSAYDRPQLAFSIHFNLACAYSLKLDTTKALQNLMMAAQIDPASTYAALGDPHLDGIRETPDFAKVRTALATFIQQSTSDSK